MAHTTVAPSDNSIDSLEDKKSRMKEEYESLRTEIIEWQNRRFILVATSITFVTGILGLGGNGIGRLWAIDSSLLLLFLASAVVLSWYAGRANTKIGAYLIVFHEGAGEAEGKEIGWERRLAMLKKKPRIDKLTLNNCLTAVYIALGIISLVVPWVVAGQPSPSGDQSFIILFTAALLLGALVLQLGWSYPREAYIKLWKDVKEDEKRHI